MQAQLKNVRITQAMGAHQDTPPSKVSQPAIRKKFTTSEKKTTIGSDDGEVRLKAPFGPVRKESVEVPVAPVSFKVKP